MLYTGCTVPDRTFAVGFHQRRTCLLWLSVPKQKREGWIAFAFTIGKHELSPEIQRRRPGHLMRAWLIRRGIRSASVGLHQIVREQKGLDLIAADIRQHLAIDLHARAQHLAAFFDHLLTLGWVVDNVPVLIREIILVQHGAHALTPATGRFQISDNLWFIHSG